MEDTRPSGADGGGGFKGVNSPSGGFTANQLHIFVFNKVIEGSHGVTAAAHTCHYHIREPSFLFHNLLSDFTGNDRLEIAYDGRERVGAHDGTKAVVSVVDPAGPLPHSFRYSIL